MGQPHPGAFGNAVKDIIIPESNLRSIKRKITKNYQYNNSRQNQQIKVKIRENSVRYGFVVFIDIPVFNMHLYIPPVSIEIVSG
jgi:hypothetical protein